jgi:hypothetical protein
MTALYAFLLYAVAVVVIVTSLAIGVVGVRNYLAEVRPSKTAPDPSRDR